MLIFKRAKKEGTSRSKARRKIMGSKNWGGRREGAGRRRKYIKVPAPMSNEQPIQDVKTLLDMRIASEIKGVPHGTVKIVRGKLQNGTVDYALFVNDEYLGSLEGVVNEQQAILVGIGKIREMVALLSE
jgi:hypothetical protein